MTFRALATDYDGTLATDGIVDELTIEALRRARRAGLKLIMVTGRELIDLFHTFPHVTLFDRLVAENGAVLYEPATKQIDVIADAPPLALVERLASEQIPVSVGHSIVATVVPHQRRLLAAIDDLGLDWHVIYNKRSVMALPANVTKATGLARALSALHIPPALTVGVGDAENDYAFLRACGVAVAVDNALPQIKQIAHVVTTEARGAGVIQLIGEILSGSLSEGRAGSGGGAGAGILSTR